MSKRPLRTNESAWERGNYHAILNIINAVNIIA